MCALFSTPGSFKDFHLLLFLVEWYTVLRSHLHCARTYGRCAGISDKEVITVSQGYAYSGGGLKIKSGFGYIYKGQPTKEY